jgi:hypothetical protein
MFARTILLTCLQKANPEAPKDRDREMLRALQARLDFLHFRVLDAPGTRGNLPRLFWPRTRPSHARSHALVLVGQAQRIGQALSPDKMTSGSIRGQETHLDAYPSLKDDIRAPYAPSTDRDKNKPPANHPYYTVPPDR